MGTASRNVSSKAIRMLPKSDAAHYCGRPIKRFEAECPVVPVRFPNGDLRWDVQELDGWIDNLKAGNVGSSRGDPGEARMTRIRVRGFQIFKDRHGTWRCYHRATRTPVDLTAAPIGSAEFFAECSRTAALSTAGGQSKAGTLGILISEYRAHSAFTCDIAARTRSDYQRVFDHLQPLSDTPLVRFDAPSVIQIRDLAARQHGRRFGNYVKQVLSLTFAWGIERGHLSRNPAEKIKALRRPMGAPDANRPWNDLERDAVLAALPQHMGVPIALMMFCGLDPQDALALPRSAIREGYIDSRRGKTHEPIWIPLPTPVKGIMKAAPPHTASTIAANSRGQVWTGSGFRASWRPIRTRLEAAGKVGPGLTLKGLRHTVATILAEMGYDDRTIADMLGQKTLTMAQHYSRRADRSRKMTSVVANFDAELNRRSDTLWAPAQESLSEERPLET